jgi:hypothetical protein
VNDSKQATMTSAHDIHARADALLRDTAPLHTAAGLGFVAERDVVDALIAQLERAAWTVVDTRGRDDNAARTAIAGAVGGVRPIALVVDTKAPTAALMFAQAVAELRHGGPAHVALSTDVDVALSERTQLVVFAAGITEHDKLPMQLQRVDFWEFLA